jgi:uncharacterized phage protein gp47/JayE
MPVPKGVIDQNGITVPTFDEVLSGLKEDFRSIYGADVYLEPDSQDGQFLAAIALAISDVNSFAVSVYNAFSPQTAQGNGLSRMVLINGIRRQAASRSTATVSIGGTAGTVIANGVVQDAANRKWYLPATVVIPVSGTIDVSVQAQDLGVVTAGAGEINRIATPTAGWQTVTNATAASPGAPIESDAALRSRQQISVALPSLSVFEGTIGAVANVPGVTRLRGYENDTGAADVNGIPAHSISVVVEAGDTTAIAEAIAKKKTPGTGTYGTTAVVVTDSYGVPNTIRFYRPSVVAIDVAVTIKALPGYLSSTGAAIKANLAEVLNALPIGDDVLLSKLYSPINGAEPDPTKRTFDVTVLEIAKHGAGPAAANIDLLFNEAASGVVANISLTVT